MRALFIKEFQELKRDRRTLAMIIMLPLLLLLVFGYAANFSVDHINVKVIGPQASSTVSYLKSLPGADKFNFVADTSAPATPAQAQMLLRSPSGDVVVIPKAKAGTLSQRVDVHLNGAKLFTAQSAKADLVQMQANDMRAQLKQLSAAAAQAQQSAQGLRTNPTQAAKAAQAAKEQSQKLQALAKQAQETNTNWIKVEFNPDLKTSWVMIPGLIGLVMAVIGTLITSIGMVREREAGTLEQLAVMPIKARSIIAGKISPYFMLAIVDMSAGRRVPVRYSLQRTAVAICAGRGAVPGRGVRAGSADLHGFADHGAGGANGDYDHHSPNTAFGPGFPAGIYGRLGALHRLSAAADLVCAGFARGDA